MMDIGLVIICVILVAAVVALMMVSKGLDWSVEKQQGIINIQDERIRNLEEIVSNQEQQLATEDRRVECLQEIIAASNQEIDMLTAERADALRRAANDWKLKLLLAACGFSIVDDPSRGGYCLYHRDGRYYCPRVKDEQVQ